jgi:invasion protein IalB
MKNVTVIATSVAITVAIAMPLAQAADQPDGLRMAQAAPPRPAPPRTPAAQAAAQPGAGGGQAPAAQAPAPQIPTRTEILNFDNWVVTCNEFAEGAKTRTCSALLRIIQQNTNQTLFAWSITIDASRQPAAVLQTPTGVNIAPGVELRIGKAAPQKIAFTACDTGGCVANTHLDANIVREMGTAATAEAVIQGSQGNNVQFTVPLKGFDRAYAALSRP